MSLVEADKSAVQGLASLGYKQELFRSRGLAHALFMTLAIMAVPYGLSAPIATSIIGGGPATIIWGWLLVSVFTQFMALSLAEICSKYPTAAGAYYWCFRLSPPKYRLVLSWINGWLTMVGVWTVSLSVTFGTAQLIVAGAGIFHPDWIAKPWQTYLIFLAVTIVATLIGIVFNSLLPTIDVIAAVWTLLGVIEWLTGRKIFLVILICTSVKAASGRHSAAFTLGHFDASFSGWAPGWTFFIGLLPPAYTYAAIGMIASMAEEVHDPSIQVPKAMVWSVPIGTITGLVFLLPIVATLPDTQILLAVASGQPIGVMFELIMGSKGGGFGMWFIIFGIGMFCAISICCAASRATWSFARDKAIPFHHIFSRVHLSSSSSTTTSASLSNATKPETTTTTTSPSPKTTINDVPSGGVPINAYLLSTTIQLLLGLIYLGSTAAFNAFVGVAVMCLGASYAMPVAISLFLDRRRRVRDAPYSLSVGTNDKRRGHQNQNRNRNRNSDWLGIAVNAVTILWVVFEMVLFSMPAVVPVTQVSMNYASAVFVGFALISAIWYMISGRFHYTGPPIPEGVSSSIDNDYDTNDDDEYSGDKSIGGKNHPANHTHKPHPHSDQELDAGGSDHPH